MKKCKDGFPPGVWRPIVTLSFVLFFSLAVSAQTTVKGSIRDNDGRPVVGATVKIKGQAVATSTADDGSFSIPAKTGDVLVISSVGFETHEIRYAGRASGLSVNLSSKVNTLDDVVVVGYGTVKKSDLTGAVGVANVGDVKKVETYDVARALQGKLAGVTVQGSGEPGGFVNIKIRGVSSLQPTAAGPLFVIDGVQIINGAPFDFPTDNIESIQVLKDASAAAIFGARGAGGVIIITTKKGRGRALQVDYNAYYGVQHIAKKLALTDRAQYQQITDQAEKNAGRALAAANDPTSPQYISNINTDWQKAAFKNGIIQNHNINLYGGNDATSYNVSMTYFNQTATVQGGAGEPKYYRYNIDANMQSKTGIVSFGAKLDYTLSHKQNLTYPHLHPNIGDEIVDIDRAIPTVPVLDSTRLGGYGGTTNLTQKAIMLNIIGMNNLMDAYSNRNRFLGDAWAAIDIIKGLQYKVNVSYDQTTTRDFFFEPKYDLGWYYPNNTAYETDTRGTDATYIVENTLTYKFDVGKNKFEVLAGTAFDRREVQSLGGIESGFNAPYYLSFSNGDPTSASVTSNTGIATTNSYFGRVNYNYDNRYLITLNGRRDGASVFSPEHRWGNFGSVAGAWTISNEKFIHLPETISFLKIRGSYGSLGSQNLPNFYAYTPFINSNASYLFGNTQGSGQQFLAPGSIQTQVADPSLKWETRITSGGGVDMGFLNNRILFTAEYYSNTAKDLIANPPIPYSVGATNVPYVNAASVQNSGLEFSVTYKKSVGDFNFTIDANATTLKNKVLKLGGTNDPISGAEAKTEVGREVGEIYGFVTQGIFQNASDLTKHAVQPNAAPGDLMFKDVDGNDTINANDMTYLGSAIPKLYYGLNVGVSWHSFDLSFAFQGNAGNKIVNGLYQTLMAGQYTNHSIDELNYWTPTHTNTNVPRPIIGDPNGNDGPSDRWVQSGSYVKLQTAQIGFTFPSRALLPTRVFRSIHLYVSGQNLFTITRYKGYDPDIISDGLFSRGFDFGSFPNPRTITFGMQVGFN